MKKFLVAFVLVLSSALAFGQPAEAPGAPASQPAEIVRPNQSTPGTSPAAQETGGYTVNLAGVQLRAVVQYISNLTNKPIILPLGFPGDQPVDVVSAPGAKVTKERLIGLLGLALRTAGFAMVESPEGIRVIKEGRGEGIPVSSLVPGQEGTAQNALLTNIVTLNYADVASVSTILTPLKSPAGIIQSYPDQNKLIITEYASQLRILLDLIAQIDRPAVNAVSEILPVVNSSVQTLQPAVSTYVENLKKMAPASRKKSLDLLNITAHTASNSFLLFGSQEDLRQVKSFIAKLDVPAGDKARTIHTYAVLHRDAQKLVDVLTGAIAAKNQSAPSAEGTFSVIADPTNNAIVIIAPADRYDNEIKPMLADLDQPRGQVQIESALVEISLDKLADLGVELATIDPSGSNPRGFGGSTFDLSTVTDAGRTPVLPPDGGLTAGIFRKSNIAALIRLSARTDDVSFIAAPRLMAADNESAEVEIAEEHEYNKVVTTADGVSTQSGGNYNKASIKLVITPHINREGTVRLEIDQTTEQFLPSSTDAQGNTLTNKTSRHAKTQIVVPNGQMAVIAGLTRTVESKIIRKVPVFGDIPLIGFFFRRTEKSQQQRNLCIFITPHVFAGTSGVDVEAQLQKMDLSDKHPDAYKAQQKTIDEVTGGRPHPPTEMQ